jgi:hypothetical protein
MDGRQGSKETSGCDRRLGRGVWVAYLNRGAALAILRVSLLGWVERRSVSHEMTETVNNLTWGLYPEGSWAGTVVSARFTSVVRHSTSCFGLRF